MYCNKLLINYVLILYENNFKILIINLIELLFIFIKKFEKYAHQLL